MSALRVRVEVAAFQALLTTLGVLMALASRRVDRFRRQVTRDLLLEIRSDDGARQQYRLHAATRRLTLPRHPAGRAECTLIFPTARVGLRILISRRAIGRLVEDMNLGDTRIDGNPALMLWLHGLTRIVAPIGSTRRPRHAAPVPVRAPERDAAYAGRIAASRRSQSSVATGRRRGPRARSSCSCEPPTGSGCRRDERSGHRAQRAHPRVASSPVGEGDDAG